MDKKLSLMFKIAKPVGIVFELLKREDRQYQLKSIFFLLLNKVTCMKYYKFVMIYLYKGHRSLMVTVARLESGICKNSWFASASAHLVFFVLSAYSETGLLLVVKLKRNVVMMRAGVKIMHQSNARRDARKTTE